MMCAHARIPGHATVRAGVRDLHPPAAPSAADDALQKRGALARGAATLAATDHVRCQPGTHPRTYSRDGDQGCRQTTAPTPRPPSVDAPAPRSTSLMTGGCGHT